MANLKEVRLRITTVSSTQQITKAMKMFSAAKLRRAQDAVIRMRPYANKLREILENLSGSMDASEGGDFAKVRPANKILIGAITSNRGLAGAFNANVIRTVTRLVREDYADQARENNPEGKLIRVMSIGKKASDFFSKNKALTLKTLRELQPGDYVTHIDHGVGVYSGLQKIEANGKLQGAVRREYKDGVLL